MVNETHDLALTSWVEGAGDDASDYPIQNLPYGVFRRAGSDEAWRVGVAIGGQILDLPSAVSRNLLEGDAERLAAVVRSESLNGLMSLGPEVWGVLRRGVSRLLRVDTAEGSAARAAASALLVRQDAAEMRLPAHVGDYTDFYASVFHATNVGSMFRPENPLLPNYKWVPIGYHGRSSSLVPSGAPVRRPVGQLGQEGSAGAPVVAPTRRLDYEAELGFWVGEGNALGESIPIGSAGRHLFGVSLLNDWSARDVQAWEYQPLGPFLAKNFATSVSPWVVTMEALAPYRVAAFRRPEGDPAPLPYLSDAADRAHGAIDVTIEVWLRTERMRNEGGEAECLSRSNARDLYWTPAQLLTHHASNGCNLRPGDLLGSGTISGPDRDARGCLLELTLRGSEPVRLSNGEVRAFLEDGDEITLRGHAARPGLPRLGLGTCAGVVLPATRDEP